MHRITPLCFSLTLSLIQFFSNVYSLFICSCSLSLIYLLAVYRFPRFRHLHWTVSYCHKQCNTTNNHILSLHSMNDRMENISRNDFYTTSMQVQSNLFIMESHDENCFSTISRLHLWTGYWVKKKLYFQFIQFQLSFSYRQSLSA